MTIRHLWMWLLVGPLLLLGPSPAAAAAALMTAPVLVLTAILQRHLRATALVGATR